MSFPNFRHVHEGRSSECVLDSTSDLHSESSSSITELSQKSRKVSNIRQKIVHRHGQGKRCTNLTPTLVKELNEIMKLKNKGRETKLKEAVLRLQHKYSSLRSVARRLKLTWGSFHNMYRRRATKKAFYTRKFDEALKQSIRKFYEDPEVSIALPEAQFHGTRFLTKTLREACKLYNDTRKGNERKVSLAAFSRLRPRKKVKLVKSIPINSCLCEVCTNFELLTKALIGSGMKGMKGNTKAAVDATVCPYSDATDTSVARYGKRLCIWRKCNLCGTDLLRKELESENKEMILENRDTIYHCWESVTRTLKGQTVSRVEKTEHSCSITKLLDLYLEKLGEIAAHKFLSVWQYKQIVKMSREVKSNEMLVSHDFAKNVVLYSQRSVQSSFYSNAQCSLCPSVAFYRCDVPGCTAVVRKEVINLSPDLKHDSHQFIRYHQDCVKLVQRDSKNNIDVVVASSDQAPGTFKNHNAMDGVSRLPQKTLMHFTGTRHGKGFR